MLAAATLSLTMMTIDVSIVRVALPTIQNDLDMSDVEQQWIVNAYLLTMAVFAIAGGRAGDRLGRRRVFLFGLMVFIGCSIACALSISSGMLIAARAGQGIGAAIMTPGNIAMVTDAFSGASLGKAMGVLVGVGSIGVSLGSLAGGVLIEFAGWEWVFLINVPVSLLVAGLVIAFVPEHREQRPPGLDIPGLLTLTIGMTALTVAVMQVPVWGFGSGTAAVAAGFAVITLVIWWRIEARAREPLVDPQVLHGAMLGANFVAFCVPFVLSGLAVLLAIYLQNVLGYTALETGFLMLPMTIPGMAGSLLSGFVLARLGPRATVTGGMALAAAGAFGVGVGAGHDDYLALLPGLVVFSFFASVALPAMTTALMSTVGSNERGMVSGVYNTARLVGATLGLAVMGSLLATLEQGELDKELSAKQIDAVEETHVHNLLAGGKKSEELQGLSNQEAARVERSLVVVFDTAFATTMKLASLVAALGAVVAFFVVPRLRAPPLPAAAVQRAALAEA